MKKKNVHYKVFMLLVLCLIIFPVGLNAQEKKEGRTDDERTEFYGKEAGEKLEGATWIKVRYNTAYPEFVLFDDAKQKPFETFLPWLNQTMKAGPDVDFIITTQETDELKLQHIRYMQTYKGIPIEDAMCMIHVKDGKVYCFNGLAMDKTPNISEVPSVSEKDALRAAMNRMGAEKYKWESEFWENNIKESRKDRNATYYPKGELYWFSENISNGDKNIIYLLCYRFDIYSASPDNGQRFYVDANSGAIIKSISLMQD